MGRHPKHRVFGGIFTSGGSCMNEICPRCKSEKTISGRCLGQMDYGLGLVFRPEGLRFLSVTGTDLAISDRPSACTECGLLWQEVSAEDLKRIIARKGKKETKEQLGL